MATSEAKYSKKYTLDHSMSVYSRYGIGRAARGVDTPVWDQRRDEMTIDLYRKDENHPYYLLDNFCNSHIVKIEKNQRECNKNL